MIDFGCGVTLWPICKRDIERLREWRNDVRVWRWCRQNDLISDVDQERWFESQSKDPAIKMYLIKNREVVCGVCGLTSIDLWNRRAEFSLYINPGETGRGNGKKGLVTLLHHAFNNLGLHLVWGETFSENPARKMFMQLGFTEDGVRRQFYWKGSKFLDAHLVSITRAEWEMHCSTQAISSV